MQKPAASEPATDRPEVLCTLVEWSGVFRHLLSREILEQLLPHFLDMSSDFHKFPPFVSLEIFQQNNSDGTLPLEWRRER